MVDTSLGKVSRRVEQDRAADVGRPPSMACGRRTGPRSTAGLGSSRGKVERMRRPVLAIVGVLLVVIDGTDELSCRLMEMGLTPGVELRVVGVGRWAIHWSWNFAATA